MHYDNIWTLLFLYLLDKNTIACVLFYLLPDVEDRYFFRTNIFY